MQMQLLPGLLSDGNSSDVQFVRFMKHVLNKKGKKQNKKRERSKQRKEIRTISLDLNKETIEEESHRMKLPSAVILGLSSGD